MRYTLIFLIIVLCINLYSYLEMEKDLEFHKNGKLKRKAFFAGEMKIREEIYYKSGDVKYIKTYFGDLDFGFWYKLDKKKNEISRGNFIVGNKEDKFFKKIKNGYYKVYFPNDSIKIKAFFFDNHLNGNYIEYHENGNIKIIASFEDGNLIGSIKRYNEDKILIGTPLSNGDYYYYYTYSDCGLIKELSITYNGKQISSFNFFDSASLEEQRIYNGGKENQTVTTFYESGQQKSKHQFVDLKGESIYVSYFENGMIELYGENRSGNEIGTWRLYHENGIIKQEVIYYKNKFRESALDRVSEYYTNGNKKITANYIGNNELNNFEYYDLNGDLILELSPGNKKLEEIEGYFGDKDYIIRFEGYK